MFGLLHQYLIEHRQVFLQGMGRMQLLQQPAAYDVANQQLTAPQNIIQFDANAEAGPLQPVMAFIARQLNTTEENAFAVYHSFCLHLQHDLEVNRLVYWDHLGAFQKDETGKAIFVATNDLDDYYEDVPAIRVIRQGATHTLMVGTTETTSTAMKEFLEEQPVVVVPKQRWWLSATAIAVVSVILIVLKKMGYT